MVRLRQFRGQLPGPTILVALAATLSAALAGCATAPSGGAPRQAPGANSQVQAYVQPLPPPGPTSVSYKSAEDVVLGFLHASASYAFDPDAARQFLAPALRKQWHPSRGVVVVGDAAIPTTASYPKPTGATGPTPPSPEKAVSFAGPPLATLSRSGQFESASGQTIPQFVLAETNGVWLIQQFLNQYGRPQQQQQLILTESDFENVYQPRNLFFFASGPGFQSGAELVPDPVYAPTQSSDSALNSGLATGLVNGLLNQPTGWLDGVATTAFLPGTKLLGKVTISGGTAQVDLGGAAAVAQPGEVVQMAYQLAATLGDPSQYSQKLASSVQLSINHQSQQIVSVGDVLQLIPSVPGGPVQMVVGTSSVAQWRGGGKLQSRLAPDQINSATITALAASPGTYHPLQLAVAVRNGAGCGVYEQPTGQVTYKSYQLSASGGPCTSLSFDAHGNLWAAAGQHIWVLQPNGALEPVNLSDMSGVVQPGDEILAVRMAPDSIRAALLVKTPAGKRLLLSAVHFGGGTSWFGQAVPVASGLSADPMAVSWYDAYHLAVLTAAGIYDVPLTTGAGQQPAPAQIATFLTLPSGAKPDSMAADHAHLVVGTNEGVFAETSSTSTPEWGPRVPTGKYPVFPG